MFKHTLIISTLFGITAILSGCGQSGPLYLPKTPKPASTKMSTSSKANTQTPAPLKPAVQTEQVEDA